MMTRNNAVMIPVMLYKMIIATAVDGDGPSGFGFGVVPFPFCSPPPERAMAIKYFFAATISSTLSSTVAELSLFVMEKMGKSVSGSLGSGLNPQKLDVVLYSITAEILCCMAS
jgi:hypothetical protein